MRVKLLHTSLVILVSVFLLRDTAIAQPAPAGEDAIERLGKLAEMDLRDRKLNLAEVEYRKIIALAPENTSAHSNLGLTYYLEGKFDPAAEQFNIALHAKPDLWNIAALCGLSEVQIHQTTNAEMHLEQAFEHVADSSLRLTVGKELLGLLSESGDLNRASDIVDKLLKLYPNNTDLLYAAHRVYLLLANRAFLNLAYVAPDSARMYQVWGDRMKLMGDTRGAAVAYRKAIERDPKLSGAHLALGDVLSVSRSATDRAAAEIEYQRALQVDPSDARAESKLGDLALQRSDLRGAEEHYRRALQFQPDDPDANEGLGDVLMESQSYNEARHYLNRAIQLDPTNGVAHYHLSQTSKKLGDNDAAKREMAEFLKLKAEDERMRSSFSSMSLGSAGKLPLTGDAIPKLASDPGEDTSLSRPRQ